MSETTTTRTEYTALSCNHILPSPRPATQPPSRYLDTHFVRIFAVPHDLSRGHLLSLPLSLFASCNQTKMTKRVCACTPRANEETRSVIRSFVSGREGTVYYHGGVGPIDRRRLDREIALVVMRFFSLSDSSTMHVRSLASVSMQLHARDF